MSYYDFPNEQAAAFDLSRREFDNGMRAIEKLTAQGLHVVATSGPAYCRFTDALIGKQFCIISSHMSRRVAQCRMRVEDDAVQKLGGWEEGGIHLFPRGPSPAPATPAADPFADDIPF